jgi:GGDEF domain-containing protein
VLFIDIDDLKTINDTLGHTAGDDLLLTAAQRLLSAVAPYDVVGRCGGDEFVTLVFGEVTSGELQDMVGRVRLELATPMSADATSGAIHPASALSTFTKTISGRPRRSCAMPTGRCMKPSAHAAGGAIEGTMRYLIRSAEMKKVVGARRRRAPGRTTARADRAPRICPAWRPPRADAAAEGAGGRLVSGAVVNFTP